MNNKRLAFLVAYTSILVLGDYALSFIPNVQIIMLLIILLSTQFRLLEALLVTTVYVLIDNLIFGGFGFYTIPMLVGWFGVIIMTKLIQKAKTINLALASLLFSVWYSIPFMLMTVYLYQVNAWQYLVADFPFMITLGLSSYFTITLLYDRLKSVLRRFLYENIH